MHQETTANRREWWLLLCIVVIGAVARFTFIGRDPFWMDEAASWWFATRPLRELWSQVPLYEAHPPLYYSLLRGWRLLVGDGEVQLRAFSALASLAVLPLVYLLGKSTLAGRPGAWLGLSSAALMAVLPMQVRYGQEARGYALLTASVAALMLGFIWFLKHPRSLEEWWTPHRRWHSIASGVLVIVTAALAFWLHQTAPLTVGLVVALAATVLGGLLGGSRRLIASLAVLALGILVLWARDIPWLAAGAAMIQEGFWIPHPDLQTLIEVSDALFGTWGVAQTTTVRTIAVLAALCVAGSGVYALIKRGNAAAALFFAASMLGPILLAFIASYAIAPIFISRIVLWTEVPFVLLASASLLNLKNPFQRAGVIAACTIVMAVVVGMRLAIPPKEDWREVAQILERESEPDDLIVVVTPYAEVPLLFYGFPRRASARWLVLPSTFPGFPDEHGVPTGFRLLTQVSDATVDRVRSLSRESRKVWFVIRSTTSYDEKSAIPRAIASTHPYSTQRVRFADLVLLTEYRTGRLARADEALRKTRSHGLLVGFSASSQIPGSVLQQFGPLEQLFLPGQL